MIEADASDSVDSNFAYGINNNNVYISNSGTFAYGTKNVFDISPAFSNATVPGAPNCQNTSSVPACMASFIADFAPTAASAKGFGYQNAQRHTGSRSPLPAMAMHCKTSGRPGDVGVYTVMLRVGSSSRYPALPGQCGPSGLCNFVS